MKTAKQRSRHGNKQGRGKSMGNVINRVFDSSGPEGKVRGTPQQVIEKYDLLARDASLAGDRVAAENFQQHAEHYLRLLSRAQKEQDSRRDPNHQRSNGNGADRSRPRQDPGAAAQPDIPSEQPVVDAMPAEGDPVQVDAAEGENEAGGQKRRGRRTGSESSEMAAK